MFDEIVSKKFLLNFSRVFSDTNILSVNDNGAHVPRLEMTLFRHELMPGYGDEMPKEDLVYDVFQSKMQSTARLF